jgi:hypothetical protein
VALAALAALFLAPGASAVTDVKRPPLKYLTLTATRYIHSIVDHGSNGQGAWDGSYEREGFWQLRVIVVFNGFGVQVVPNSGVVAGGVRVTDKRKNTSNKLPTCPAAALAGGSLSEYTSKDGPKFVAATRGDLAGVSGNWSRFFVGSRDYVRWVIGCATNETLSAHGVDDGQTVSLPAFPKAMFRGRAAVVGYCGDEAAHGDLFHTFQGVSKFSVSLAPFAASRLRTMRTRVRRAIGGTLSLSKEAQFPGGPQGVSAATPDPSAPDCD